MTVEAKLRVAADLKDSRAQVQGLERDLLQMRKAGTDKTDRAAFEGLRASLRQAKEATRELAAAQVEQQKTANKSLIQNVQLSAQLQDFFVQVQAGGNPLTAAIQQGSQLSFIYGGAGNALKAVTSLFTPLRIAAGGAAAGIGLLAAAYLGGEKQSNDFARSLQITGGFAGITAGQFEDMAQRVSRSVDSSIGGAKDTIQGLVSTGKFTSTALEPVATAIEKVSALTGQTREEVIKDFEAMAEGGVVKFAEKLNSKYNFLDLATYKYVKRLQEQGRETEAQVVLMNKLNQGLGDINANLGLAERAWKGIAKAASDAWDAFLGVGRTTTVEERLKNATDEAARKAVQLDAVLNGKGRGGKRADTLRRELADARSEESIAQSDARLLNRATQERAIIAKTNKAEIAEQIKKDKEAGKNQLTRLAQTKQLYDAELELANDASQRELKLLEDQYKQGLVTLEFYLGRKAALQEQDAAQDIARLNARLKAEQATLAANQPRLAEAQKRKDKNGVEQAEESILQSRQKIAQLETDIVKRQRDQADAARDRLQEERRITDELIKQFAAFEAAERQATGQRSTPDQARQQAFERYRALYEKLGVAGDTGGQAVVNQAVDRAANKILFDQARAELERVSADLKVREDAIRVADEQAGVSAIQTEQKIIAARQEQIVVVQRLIEELAKLAGSPDDKTRVDQARVDLSRLKDTTTEVERTLRSAGERGVGQFVKDVVTGAKTAEEAFKGFLASIATQTLDLIAQELGKDLLNSFLPRGGSGGGGGGIISAIASLFGFHSGGVVRPGGQTFTRQIPMGLATAMARYAPRYHTGGIAGFAPNEVPAVLKKGEEVLTADDPRHINNVRSRGGMSVEVNTTINGAQGGAAQQEGAANELAGNLEAAIDQWALKHQRPGGILFKGRG